MKKLLPLLLLLVGCSKSPDYPVLFKTWNCQFENTGTDLTLVIRLDGLQYGVPGTFTETVTDNTQIPPQSQDISIDAQFNLNGTIEIFNPAGNTTFVVTHESLVVTAPAEPAWGNLLCN